MTTRCRRATPGTTGAIRRPWHSSPAQHLAVRLTSHERTRLMNDLEIAELWRLPVASFPAQRDDPRTPEAWQRQIPVGFEAGECMSAVDRLAQRQRFCALSDIITEVRAARDRAWRARELAALVAGSPYLAPPARPQDPPPPRRAAEPALAPHWPRPARAP